jgi:SAM-dependent methyltransferase
VGIIRSNAAFYLDARRRGVDFGRTVTLGRQRVYLRPGDFRALAGQYLPGRHVETLDLDYGGPADAFLARFLGVRELTALDHSTYEGAGLIHDLNVPVPADLEQRFDAVVDAGTLEHVFNAPVAFANCMRMVKPGGTVFLCSPANNTCGHGFYQFSPEFFFRVFDRANGFSLTRLVLVTHPFPGAELSSRQTWYEVRDPAAIGARAPLMTTMPAFLMVEARRVEAVPILAHAPQQSDYVTRWAPSGPVLPATGFARSLFRRAPASVRAFVTGWYQRAVLCNLHNRRAFRRLTSRRRSTMTPPSRSGGAG